MMFTKRRDEWDYILITIGLDVTHHIISWGESKENLNLNVDSF